MTAARLVLSAAIGLAVSGCRVAYNLDRTMRVEPHHYHNFFQEYLDRRCYRRMAWSLLERQGYEVRGLRKKKLEGYPHGFEDGFVDYLMAGGDGLPPPIPPHKYWGHRYQTAEGRRLADAWFVGFREGAEAARNSGLRRLITVPSSLYLAESGDSASIELEPSVLAPAEAASPFEELPARAGDEPPAPAGEELPAPAGDEPPVLQQDPEQASEPMPYRTGEGEIIH